MIVTLFRNQNYFLWHDCNNKKVFIIIIVIVIVTILGLVPWKQSLR